MEGFNAGLGKNLPAPEEKATKDTMSDGGIFKAKMVFIKHSEQDGPRNGVNVLQGKTFQLKHPVDHVRLPQITPSFSVRAENTRNHRLADGTASMETAVDKHRGISPQPCHHISPGAEVSSDCFVTRASEDRASPTDSSDLFPTPASSRESILSEGWDKEKSWSAMQLSNGDDFSRTASPCSPVRSGVFSPAVVRPHKIKSSYKSLAAIPTNTILLDQQAIDDQVERNEHPTETQDSCVTDTHVEMCSPAQLRQQSEELYAAIDEILEDSIPMCHTSREHQRPNATQQNTSMPRLGRETKYASLGSLNSSTSAEGKLLDTNKTKPGVIRPLNAIPRLTVEDEESHPNPFRQYVAEPTVTDQNMPSRPIVTIHENEALISNKLEREMDKEKHENVEGHTYKGEEGKKQERANTFSMSALLITETEDHGTL